MKTMKRKSLKVLAAMLVFCFALSACGGADSAAASDPAPVSSSAATAKPGKLPAKTDKTDKTGVTEKPGAAQPPAESAAPEAGGEDVFVLAEKLVGYWSQSIYEPDADWCEWTITLWLSSPYDASASFEVRDPASLERLARYDGTWMCRDAEHLELDLTCTENASGLDFYSKPIQGTYFYSFTDSGTDSGEKLLTLTVEDEAASPLCTDHAYEPITLVYNTNPADDSSMEEKLCYAAQNYYSTVYGYLPGYADPEGYEDGCLVVHLYDDMGDHIATSARYIINPDTLYGYDDMTGEEIDFAGYLEVPAVG